MRAWPAYAGILVVAAAFRLPGIEWGFAVEPGVFHPLHPDEGVICFELWTRGGAWLADPANWHERGMQVQCRALAALVHGVAGADATLATFVRAARLYSVLWGLAGVLVAALVARAIDSDPRTRERSGLCAALLCALAGAHVVTSFWARGQIQNSVCFFASVFFAQRSLDDRRPAEPDAPPTTYSTTYPTRAARWLCAAGVACGLAIGLRWSVALLPMLAVAAWASRERTWSLAAAAFGCVVGFAAGTGFVWTPAQVDTFVRTQSQAMLHLERGAGPLAVGAAAVFCTIVGCGLATGLLGAWGVLRRAATFRWRLTPAALLLLPIAVQLVMVAALKCFEARHTDLLSTALAIVAGVELARLTAPASGRRRLPAAIAVAIVVAIVVATIGYQTIYAWGVVTRFTADTRNHLAERVGAVVPRAAPLFASWYVPPDALARAGFALTEDRRAAAYVVVHEQHALRYLARSGTFLFLGAPPSCREVYNCWTEEEREFYQALLRDGGGARVVRRYRAAVWTPELALYRRLMGSKWMFTADLVIATPPGS